MLSVFISDATSVIIWYYLIYYLTTTKKKTKQRKSQQENYTFSTFGIFSKLNLTVILL